MVSRLTNFLLFQPPNPASYTKDDIDEIIAVPDQKDCYYILNYLFI